jgi:hypothetical protein
VKEPDALKYPTDQVVGIVPDRKRLDDVLTALRDAGATDERITVLRGPNDGDLEPDPTEGSKGVMTRIVQRAQKVLGDEAERLKQLDEALAAGHDVIGVHLGADEDEEDARDAEKQALGAALRRSGAQDVAFYGEYQIQQLDAGATG